jgi:hypothetical protein
VTFERADARGARDVNARHATGRERHEQLVLAETRGEPRRRGNASRHVEDRFIAALSSQANAREPTMISRMYANAAQRR